MPLTRQQMQDFEQRLKQRYTTLCEEIREGLLASDEASYAELAGEVHDPGDKSVADMLEGINHANANRWVEQLHAIDRALGAIAAGQYGQCVDCGVDINPERLEAVPWAERCIQCKEIWEHNHAMASDRARQL